jgi:hypothetical protein
MPILYGYCDASWGCQPDAKSVTGWLFKIGSGPVSWCSKVQTTTALSTAEAEYVALSSACQEAMFLRSLLEDCGVDMAKPTTIFEDNEACIKIAKNDMVQPRTRHIHRKYHYAREVIQRGQVHLEFCPTDLMVADMFTKVLPKEKFLSFVKGAMETNLSPTQSGSVEYVGYASYVQVSCFSDELLSSCIVHVHGQEPYPKMRVGYCVAPRRVPSGAMACAKWRHGVCQVCFVVVSYYNKSFSYYHPGKQVNRL